MTTEEQEEAQGEYAAGCADEVVEWLKTLDDEVLTARARGILGEDWGDWLSGETTDPTQAELIEVIVTEVGHAELYEEIPE